MPNVHLTVYGTMQTQNYLVLPVSSHVVDSHPGKLNQPPGAQQFFLFHKCLRIYPEPGHGHAITCEHAVLSSKLRPLESILTHLSLDKFIPVVVWERAARKIGSFVNYIKKKAFQNFLVSLLLTIKSCFLYLRTVYSGLICPTGPWCHHPQVAQWCRGHQIPAFSQVLSLF